MQMKELILKKIELMKKYVSFLRSVQNISLEELGRDYELKCAVERNFHLALECIIDIGEIVISNLDLEKPETYRDVIRILAKHSILERGLAKKLEKAIGFRNILVHGYADVDIKKLHAFLKKLEDFDEFAKQIVKFIEKKKII